MKTEINKSITFTAEEVKMAIFHTYGNEISMLGQFKSGYVLGTDDRKPALIDLNRLEMVLSLE